MAYEIQGKVGIQGATASLGDGTVIDPYMGKQAQMIVQDFAPKYLEAGYRGLAFCGSAQAGIAVSTGFSTTATGLILINPLNSGKNLWLVDLVVSQTSTAAAAANAGLVLAANTNPVALASYTLTTSLTVQPTLLGSTATPVGKLLTAATLPTAPVAVRSIWQPSVSATATTAIPPLVKDEIAGAIGVAPGCAVSLSALSAISVLASLTWIELPL
jgi:hypothetical protein